VPEELLVIQAIQMRWILFYDFLIRRNKQIVTELSKYIHLSHEERARILETGGENYDDQTRKILRNFEDIELWDFLKNNYDTLNRIEDWNTYRRATEVGSELGTDLRDLAARFPIELQESRVDIHHLYYGLKEEVMKSKIAENPQALAEIQKFFMMFKILDGILATVKEVQRIITFEEARRTLEGILFASNKVRGRLKQDKNLAWMLNRLDDKLFELLPYAQLFNSIQKQRDRTEHVDAVIPSVKVLQGLISKVKKLDTLLETKILPNLKQVQTPREKFLEEWNVVCEMYDSLVRYPNWAIGNLSTINPTVDYFYSIESALNDLNNETIQEARLKLRDMFNDLRILLQEANLSLQEASAEQAFDVWRGK